MEVTYKKRHRVNFSTSVKGIVTCDVTFEGIDMEKTDVIDEATKLLDEAMAIARQRSI